MMEDGQQSGRAPASAGRWSPVRTCPGVSFCQWSWGRWHLSIRVGNGVLGGCHPHLPTCHHIPVTGLLGVSEAYFSESQPHPPWALCPSTLPSLCLVWAPPPPPTPASAGGSAFLRGREPGLDWEGGGACSEAAQLWWRVASPGGVELSRLGHTTPPGAPPWHPVPTADPELPDRCHRSRGPAPGEDQQCRAGACQAAGLPAVGSGPGAGPAGVCLPPQLCPADPQTGRWEGSATACLCEGPGGRGHTVCPRKAATGAHEEGSCVPVKLLSQRRAGAGPVPAATGRPSAPSPASCLR